MISPVFEKLSQQAEFDNVDFYKVDIDEQEEIAASVGIRAVSLFRHILLST